MMHYPLRFIIRSLDNPLCVCAVLLNGLLCRWHRWQLSLRSHFVHLSLECLLRIVIRLVCDGSQDKCDAFLRVFLRNCAAEQGQRRMDYTTVSGQLRGRGGA